MSGTLAIIALMVIAFFAFFVAGCLVFIGATLLRDGLLRLIEGVRHHDD